MADNPFMGLMTPDVPAAQRKGQFEQEYAQANPWVRMAAEAGFNLREADKARGIGLTAEEKKAQMNQRIMEESQKSYASYVQGGQMTAEEAQAKVLEESIRRFAANGEYQQALSLTQPLAALKDQQLERQKLKAEIKIAEAQPELNQLKVDIQQQKADADAAAKLSQLEVAAMRAETAAERAAYQNQLNALQGEYLLAKIEALKAKETEKPKLSAGAWKEQNKINTGTMAAADAMDDG